MTHETLTTAVRSATRPAAAPPSSDVDRATELVPVPDSRGDVPAVLDAGWPSLVGVHDGYRCALGVRGAEPVAPHRSVRTSSTSYLRD